MAGDGTFDTGTWRRIEAWRGRIGLPVSEVMYERTRTPLICRTRNPRYADLSDAPPASTLVQGFDPRCAAGMVVCASKKQQKISYGRHVLPCPAGTARTVNFASGT